MTCCIYIMHCLYIQIPAIVFLLCLTMLLMQSEVDYGIEIAGVFFCYLFFSRNPNNSSFHSFFHHYESLFEFNETSL